MKRKWKIASLCFPLLWIGFSSATFAEVSQMVTNECRAAEYQYKQKAKECWYQGNRLGMHLTPQDKAVLDWCKKMQEFLHQCRQYKQQPTTVQEEGFAYIAGNYQKFRRVTDKQGGHSYQFVAPGTYGPVYIRATSTSSYPVPIPCTQGSGYLYTFEESITTNAGQIVTQRQGVMYLEPHNVGGQKSFRAMMLTQMVNGMPLNISGNSCRPNMYQMIYFNAR